MTWTLDFPMIFQNDDDVIEIHKQYAYQINPLRSYNSHRMIVMWKKYSILNTAAGLVKRLKTVKAREYNINDYKVSELIIDLMSKYNIDPAYKYKRMIELKDVNREEWDKL